MTTSMIELNHAAKTFTMHLQGGVVLPVISGVSFNVQAGECVVLAGPSGIGKSSIEKFSWIGLKTKSPLRLYARFGTASMAV